MYRKIIIFILLFVTLVIGVINITAVSNQDKDLYKFVSTPEKKIALTFDDGPHPTQTKEILDILKKYDVKATFFVVGINAENNPDILKLTKEQGHEIGNHTYSHNNIKTQNKKTLTNELNDTRNIIFDICGYNTTLFRSPGGVVTPVVREISRKSNYKIILWNVDTRDWAHNSTENIVKNVLSNTNNGSIILFHDYIYKNSPTPEALEIIIPSLLKKGYTFCTVSELLECEEKTTNAR